MDYLTYALLIGAGATALIDAWALARKRLLGIPSLDYALVGRWLAYLARGRFRHERIAASQPVRRRPCSSASAASSRHSS